MKTTLHPYLLAAALSLLLLQAGCNGGGGGDSGAGDPPPGGGNPPVATPTPVGTPNGDPVSASIGVAGGSLATPDGHIRLTIPPEALSAPTTLTLQPITNHAHARLGQAYRLMPEGLTFAKPARITFRYSDQDMHGTAPGAMGIAFQRADGRWQWVKGQEVNTTAKTITVQTTHFSDWSLIAGYQLWPLTASVKTGKTVSLELVNCVSEEDEFGLVPLVHTCQPATPMRAWVDNWSVNGTAGGTSSTGTISGSLRQATFTAPATRPEPATVTVSAELTDVQELIHGNPGQKVLLMSHITITDSSDYTGNVQFQNPFATGTAQVSWKKLREEQGVAIYSASGTVNITTRVEDCVPQTFSFPLIHNTDTSATYKMQVYPDGMGERSKRYNFHLVGQGGTVGLNCGGQTLNFPVHLLTTLAVGVENSALCPEPPPAYTDVAQLSGHWSCAQADTTASWSFTAQ